jgi:hypothetical protein
MRGAALRLFACILALALAPGLRGRSLAQPAPPPLALPIPGPDVPEARVDALAQGDVRRPELLLDLALSRHAEAERVELEERRAHAEAEARWSEAARAEGPQPEPPPALATPRADALRAEAVRLAERALAEAAPFRGGPEALLVAGVDAGRIGRGRDALRFLAELVRHHAESAPAQDAWLALGERRLADGELTRARAAFEAAGRGDRDEVRAFARERLAEVDRRVGAAR